MWCSGLPSSFSTCASSLESKDDLGLDSARVEEQVGQCRLTQGLELMLEWTQGQILQSWPLSSSIYALMLESEKVLELDSTREGEWQGLCKLIQVV
ncbi:hypothetical protein QQF64_025639 [Cirrhinus molitorella]|uniref:Uncharacterized protein n=1 Tax=Cirrhinus molitorella TaxID=172907 RepID=A0ABR3NPL3_9TELE